MARLSKLFKVAAESLYLTTSGSSVVFPDSDGQLSHLGETDYYVNGDPSNEVQKETPLTNIINRGQPDTQSVKMQPIYRPVSLLTGQTLWSAPRGPSKSGPPALSSWFMSAKSSGRALDVP